MVAAVGPGGVVRLLPGMYQDTYVPVAHGGTSVAPVTITGMDGQDKPVLTMAASDRGKYLFNLQDGANYLRWTGLTIQGTGLAVWKVTGAIAGLELDHLATTATRSLIYMDGAAGTALDGYRFHDITAAGFTRGYFSMFNAPNGVIEDAVLDGQLTDGDPIPVGASFDGTSHNIDVRRVIVRNVLDSRGGNTGLYWNADGFSTEGSTYDIRFTDCAVDTAADAGFDLKGGTVDLPQRIIRGASSNVKRNIRIWGYTVVTTISLGDPVLIANAAGDTQKPSAGGRAIAWMERGATLDIAGATTSAGAMTQSQVDQTDGASTLIIR